MNLFKKQEPKKTVNVPNRVKNLDRSSLLSWFDLSIMNLGASFDKWRYHSGEASEVSGSLDAINAIWEELQQRVDKEQ